MSKKNISAFVIVLILAGAVWVASFISWRRTDEILLEKEVWNGLLLKASAPLKMTDGAGVVLKSSSVADLAKMFDHEALERLKKGKFTAAICMHGMNDVRNDWSLLQIAGLRKTFEKLGVRVIVVTDGEFDIEKQIADYEHVISLKPDVIVTIPIDSARAAPILKKAVDGGIRIVFMDSVPNGFVAGKDYIGMVMADSYSNARFSGKLLAD